MPPLHDRAKNLLPSFLRRRLELEYVKETHINRSLARARGQTTYVEIGVRDGQCIGQIRATTRIAIDPAPVGLNAPVWKGVILHQRTSDEYFDEVAPRELKDQRIDVALVDGLHEFRQTLRDVLNLEQYMSPDGVIYIHDCNPPTRENAENMNGPWNGDVWKVALYLQRFRPDLKYFTRNCDWGLGVVRGFSQTPPEPEEREVERIAALDYDVLARNRNKILNLKWPLNPVASI